MGINTSINEDREGIHEELLYKKNTRSGSLVMEHNIVSRNNEAVTNVEDALALAGGFGRF